MRDEVNSWNYRVFRESDGTMGIIECYYEDDKPTNYSDFMAPYGESEEELRKDIVRMLDSMTKPILTEADFNK